MKKFLSSFLILLFFIVFVFPLLLSGCGSSSTYLTIIEGVRFRLFRSTEYSWSQSNIVSEGDIIRADSLNLNVRFLYQKLAQTTNQNWSWINKANASKINNTRLINVEKLKDIKFYTYNQYNDNYVAHSNITEIVRIITRKVEDTIHTELTVEEFIKAFNDGKDNALFGIYDGWIKLAEAPDTNVYHKFYTTAITENESVLSDTTISVYVIP